MTMIARKFWLFIAWIVLGIVQVARSLTPASDGVADERFMVWLSQIYADLQSGQNKVAVSLVSMVGLGVIGSGVCGYPPNHGEDVCVLVLRGTCELVDAFVHGADSLSRCGFRPCSAIHTPGSA